MANVILWGAACHSGASQDSLHRTAMMMSASHLHILNGMISQLRVRVGPLANAKGYALPAPNGALGPVHSGGSTLVAAPYSSEISPPAATTSSKSASSAAAQATATGQIQSVTRAY